jgi:methylglutaconyl-CoA hydratase
MADTAEAKLLIDVTGNGVATVTLNRPKVRNAFDEELIGALSDAFADLARDPALRALVLQGEGKIFSAGADLNYMARAARASAEENRAQARALAVMLDRLDRFPRPTLALVQGAAIAGGIGLVAACDVVVTAEGAVFSLSEVRLGIAPAVVAPYVIRAIGPRAARRYFVSAERFDATEAYRIGLVSEVVAPDQLEAARDRLLAEFAKGGPNAQAAAKAAVEQFRDRPIDAALAEETTELIASLRETDEGKEGIAAFLEKRSPAWQN